jgi:hypothetical protein
VVPAVERALTFANALLEPRDDAFALVGVLYVLEGSRLGGAVLARDYARCLGVPHGTLVCFGGDRMGGPSSVLLPKDVSQGGTVDVSVNLTAPTAAGNYAGYWMLALSDGTRIGFGPKSDQPITVVIKVPSSSSSGATRVDFAAGATSSSVSGSLNANQSTKYIVRPRGCYLLQEYYKYIPNSPLQRVWGMRSCRLTML